MSTHGGKRPGAGAQWAATNAHLKANGYLWVREDGESMDFLGPNAFAKVYGEHISYAWVLVAPDGRKVSVVDALAEIAAK